MYCMTSASATSARNCPVCGSRNSGLSLFCAECGAALNGSSEGDTTAFQTDRSDHDAQRTQAFVPTSTNLSDKDHSRWQSPDAIASSSVSPSQDTSAYPWKATPPGEPQRVDTSWQSSSKATSVQPVQADEGIRGFVLGVLAAVLIAALLCLYVWAGVLSENTQDTVTGWFDFVGG
jgi:hypothetical protein